MSSAQNEREQRRSLIFSILKCGYGWNGVCTAQTPDLDALALNGIDAGECNDCIAARIAHEILVHCGRNYFRPRVDGRPNHRIAV